MKWLFLPGLDEALSREVLDSLVVVWTLLGEEIEDLQRRRNALREKGRRRVELEGRTKLLEELRRAWGALRPGKKLPGRNGGLDLDEVEGELRAEAERRGETVPLQPPSLVAWRSIREACAAWSEALMGERQARKILEQSRARKNALDTIADLDEFVTNVGAKTGAFTDKLRAALVGAVYEDPLNEAMQHILHRFAHHPEVRRGTTVRFEKLGALRVKVESGTEGKKASSGLISLSRSQLGSLALSLTVATQLGNPEVPTAFLCLDDFSDLFYLKNLAADAAVLRVLAYGPEKARRQVILTTHHDEITDRLLPLLLPPRDRKMRGIEFKNWSSSEGVKVEQWDVRGERAPPKEEGESPLKALLREREERGGTA